MDRHPLSQDLTSIARSNVLNRISTTIFVKNSMLIGLLLVFATMDSFGLTPDQIKTLPNKEVEKQLWEEHPSSYYVYAGRLFAEGKKDEAVVWLYVGKLRFRFHLGSKPDLDPSGDPVLFASLNATLGQSINEYAGGDIDAWVKQMRAALDWDESNKNGYTSKSDNKKVLEEQRKGLLDLVRHVELNADKFRKVRKENGLENRGVDGEAAEDGDE